MSRTISIVLIVAMALQTVGCSTWQPLVRVNEVFKDDNQTPMREQAMAELREGMRLRIVIRAGTQAPITGRVIKCLVEEIGHTALTVTPVSSFSRGIEITLRYADIVSIEYRQESALPVFLVGVVVGTLAGFYGTGIIVFKEQEFDKTEGSNWETAVAAERQSRPGHEIPPPPFLWQK